MLDPRDDPGRVPSPGAFPDESFVPLLTKEIERSRRYYRGFGLVRVQPGAAGPRGCPGEAGGRAEGRRVPAGWLQAIAGTVRRADLVSHAPEGGLYILLPETPASGMQAITRRLEEALAASGGAAGSSPAPVIRQAAYPRDGETAGELLEVLSETLQS